ncbi:MAG: peptidoglycan DD-metalloendopeptidase family protein [Gammaproteobacteria bacterium]|nr:peptidoglycan DD-metalloendopeptidase family protein [Gammaproteobacteria bacterium]
MRCQRSCTQQAKVFLVSLLVLGLIACSNNVKQWNPDDYTVKSGDTIYSIAWRYELDPEAFSAWNNISANNVIKPGQRLHTRKPNNFVAKNNTSYAPHVTTKQPSAKLYTATKYSIPFGSKWVKATKGDTLYSISKRSGVTVNQLIKLNQLKRPYTIHPGQTIFLKPLNTSANKNKKQKAKSTATSTTKVSPSSTQKFSWPKSVRWRKPVKGRVIKKYSRNRNDAKGIDIAGSMGATIVAAADGKVVYSGNGLISYGNLIIIKHNNTYLSAYAYNRKIIVKQGDSVKAGQKIAEMGRKDKSSARLHFEIRKNGKPVDPLKYLPW